MWLFYSCLIAGIFSASSANTLWNAQNCPDGRVTDAVCCADDECAGNYDEGSCMKDPTCLWKEGKCAQNRDASNNVCCRASGGDMCGSITLGACPSDHQVPAGCCSEDGLKWNSVLTVNITGYVCCNAPCNDTAALGCQAPPRCHERSLYRVTPENFGFQRRYIDEYLNDPFAFPVGTVFPGNSYGHDYGSNEVKKVEEITVDDLMNALIEALGSDKDVIEYKREFEADPLFGGQTFGGHLGSFNYLNPDYFLNSLYDGGNFGNGWGHSSSGWGSQNGWNAGGWNGGNNGVNHGGNHGWSNGGNHGWSNGGNHGGNHGWTHGGNHGGNHGWSNGGNHGGNHGWSNGGNHVWSNGGNHGWNGGNNGWNNGFNNGWNNGLQGGWGFGPSGWNFGGPFHNGGGGYGSRRYDNDHSEYEQEEKVYDK